MPRLSLFTTTLPRFQSSEPYCIMETGNKLLCRDLWRLSLIPETEMLVIPVQPPAQELIFNVFVAAFFSSQLVF